MARFPLKGTITPLEATNLSRSQRGYKFQFDLTKRIIQKLNRFRSVTPKDLKGNVLSLDNVERRGPDGGIDLVIEIESSSEAAGKQTLRKVRKMLLTEI